MKNTAKEVIKLPSKKDYSDTFNKLFGTNIDWTKLSKEELAQLATALSNPELILKKLGYLDNSKNSNSDDLVEKAKELIDVAIDKIKSVVNMDDIVDEISSRVANRISENLSKFEGPIIKKIREKLK